MVVPTSANAQQEQTEWLHFPQALRQDRAYHANSVRQGNVLCQTADPNCVFFPVAITNLRRRIRCPLRTPYRVSAIPGSVKQNAQAQ